MRAYSKILNLFYNRSQRYHVRCPCLLLESITITASVDLREKVAFGPDKLGPALEQLRDHEAVNGSVIVSTCNRTEVYCDVAQQGARNKLIDWLAQFHQVNQEDLMPSLYVHEEQAAIKHLMRVSCGLDSLVLGEPQILGQVKQAFSDSRDHQAVDASIDKLFQKDFLSRKTCSNRN